MLINLKNEDFNKEIEQGLVIVDFYADWCGPCKMLSPIIEEVSNYYKVIKVNVDVHDNLARKYGIMSIPTIIIFNDNKLKNKIIGYVTKDQLVDAIKSA